MLFSSDFEKEARKLAEDYIADSAKKEEERIFSKIEIEIEEFADPPVEEICRAMSASLPFEMQENLTRHCILGKKVKVMMDGKFVDGFVMNNLHDRWNTFKVLVDYPLALQMIIDICVAYISKKFMPPLRNIPPKAEQVTRE